MLCQRCGQREATVRRTRLDDSQPCAETEEICADCAGPVDQLTDHWQRLVAASQEPLTPESIARLEELQAEGAKLMEQVAGPLLPPDVLLHLRAIQENPKLRPRQPPPDLAE
jgi:protein-arginine kinase activator protein McsA